MGAGHAGAMGRKRGATSACVPRCAPQNMSNAVLAFAKLEYRPPDSCLEGLARTALQRIKTFSPQALSNTLWGLSKLDIKARAGRPCCRGGCVWFPHAAAAPWLRVLYWLESWPPRRAEQRVAISYGQQSPPCRATPPPLPNQPTPLWRCRRTS